MDQGQYEKILESMSNADMAIQLAQNIEQYKNIIMDPETTMSIPDLNRICMMADELAKRLSI
jgi:hypothetical protein